MILNIGGSSYKQCYGDKFIRIGDPVPYFDMHFPSKMAPIPMYRHIGGKMEKFMVPHAITVEKVAEDADKEYKTIKKADIETWHYVKEKYRQWSMENAKNHLIKAMQDQLKPKAKVNKDEPRQHKWLVVPYMKRFEIAE